MPETNKDLSDGGTVEGRAGASGKEKKKGGSRSPLLFLAMVLFPAAGGAYFAYSQYTTIAQAAVSVGLELGKTHEPEENEPIEYGLFATINELLINPAQSNGKRFLVVSIGVETPSGDVITELEEKDVVVRDAILRLLSRRTAEELSAIELRAEIKNEILSELNTILQSGKIDRLYFTQYLLQ